MNNPLDYAITNVVSNIPPQILEVALRQSNLQDHANDTLVTFIVRKIIEARVLKECNLSGGKVKTIALKNNWIESCPSEHGGYAGDDGPYTLFRIPPEARDNLPIANVLSVQYPYNTYIGGGVGDLNLGTGGYSLIDQVNEVLNSYTLAYPRNHPTAQLMAGDLVKLVPSQYANQNWLLTVRLCYDSSFTNLHDHAIPILANLVLYATRTWCYNNLRINIDRAVQESGADIGSFLSIIDEYRDSAQLYAEEMVKFRGASLMDPEVRRRLLIYQI